MIEKGINSCSKDTFNFLNPLPSYDRSLSYIFFASANGLHVHERDFCPGFYLPNLPNLYFKSWRFFGLSITFILILSFPTALELSKINCIIDQVSPDDKTFLSLFKLQKESTIKINL